jgi:hypothetical protein
MLGEVSLSYIIIIYLILIDWITLKINNNNNIRFSTISTPIEAQTLSKPTK